MKSNSNNSQQLRKQIQSLVQARQSLETYSDISGSMVKMTKTLNNIKPLMTKQTEYIKTFLQGDTTNDSTSKQSETRRYIARICDISLKEMSELFGAGQSYFSLDIKTSWTKLCNEYQKRLLTEKEQNEKSNILQFLFKLMNIKDKMIKQFLKSLIYRKCLLWRDLNIVNSGYVHSQKKKTSKLIEEYISNKKYAPTKPFFFLPQFETPGQWNINKSQCEDSPISQFLKLLNDDVEEVFGTIRNYSGLNEQQRNHQDIRRNSEQVVSLRGQIEQGHINYQILQQKLRQIVSKDQKLDIIEMKQKLKVSEQSLEAKEQELKVLKAEYRDYTSNMNAQKEKIKQLETDLERINAIQLKKLKEIQLLQFSLGQQVNRIAKNMSSFGSMFQFQSEGKQSLVTQIIVQKQKMQKMAEILGRHKNDKIRLQDDIKRLNLIIIELGLQIKQLKSNKGSFQ